MVVPAMIPSIGQIDLFKNDLYLIGLSAKRKKTSKERITQKMWIWIYNECDSLTSWHKINLDRLALLINEIIQ